MTHVHQLNNQHKGPCKSSCNFRLTRHERKDVQTPLFELILSWVQNNLETSQSNTNAKSTVSKVRCCARRIKSNQVLWVRGGFALTCTYSRVSCSTQTQRAALGFVQGGGGGGGRGKQVPPPHTISAANCSEKSLPVFYFEFTIVCHSK